MITSDDKLTIEIWSDVICPWCWIGLTRLQKALHDFDHADQVELIHHAYRLMPGMPPSPVAEVFSSRLGMSPAQVPSALQQVEQTAAAEGLTYRLANTRVGDTLDAHRLIKLAETQGKGGQAVTRFYRAHFSEEVSVFDRESLLALTIELGLDRDQVQSVLDGDAFRADVDADQRKLQGLGGNGVPFFLIGGQYGVSGAQSQEVFARALARAWADRPNRPVMMGEGAVCGPDGCDIA